MRGIEIPAPADLLEIARRTLLDEVVPTLEDDAVRFRALMVANAMAIAMRALRDDAGTMDAALAALGPLDELCSDIRAGRLDPGSARRDKTAAALLALAEARCWISAPKAFAAKPRP